MDGGLLTIPNKAVPDHTDTDVDNEIIEDSDEEGDSSFIKAVNTSKN